MTGFDAGSLRHTLFAHVEPLDAVFGCVEVDPPWRHPNPGAMHGANGRRGTRPDYETMSVEELKAWRLPVRVADQAHIWVWATQHHLRFADEMIEAWGFRPAYTGRVWVKTQPANGYWFGQDVEYVRLGVRGPAFRADAKAILGYHPRASFRAPRGPGGHSSKPDLFYAETRAISPGPYASLFQRTPREGWVGWGAEYPIDAQRASMNK